ncbi:hypothetical protein GCM10029964_017230 [Kibdelosporangium lantanae]
MPNSKSETELASLDIPSLWQAGDRGQLFGEGAVGAGIVLHRLGTIPRSLTYLAELVQAGGVRRALDLPEPLPTPEQTDALRPWLRAAADSVTGLDGDEEVARWLNAVATIIAARLAAQG